MVRPARLLTRIHPRDGGAEEEEVPRAGLVADRGHDVGCLVDDAPDFAPNVLERHRQQRLLRRTARFASEPRRHHVDHGHWEVATARDRPRHRECQLGMRPAANGD